MRMTRERIKRVFYKLKSGKEKFFDEFYSLTKTPVYFTVRKFFRDEFFIDDVMQDTYVSFLSVMNSIEGDPFPYLISIAKNKAIDVIRREAKTDKNVEVEKLNNTYDDVYSHDFPLLEKIKTVLDEEELFIIEKVVICGFTQTEVAHMLRKPITTINYKYKTLLKKLKNMQKEAYK